MSKAKSIAIGAIATALAVLGLTVGTARAESQKHQGDWYSVYDGNTGVWLFDYCKCVLNPSECAPCEELVGALQKRGITVPVVEQKKN